MKVVAVASPFGGQEKVIAASPDFFIESITELLDLLERHNSRVLRNI
jgi:phosphoglycolate phosphatase-like HAD superfamily hydrolase